MKKPGMVFCACNPRIGRLDVGYVGLAGQLVRGHEQTLGPVRGSASEIRRRTIEEDISTHFWRAHTHTIHSLQCLVTSGSWENST